MEAVASSFGRITIANEAVAQIVGHTAAECYGVVGIASRGRLPKLLSRDRVTQGVEVGRGDDGVAIDLRVVVEYGLNLAEVASTPRSRVAYAVERLSGLRVAPVEVHLDDVGPPAW